MKKIFFIAIAMIVFTGTMNAQTKSATKTEDKDCADKRDIFIKGEKDKGKSDEEAKKNGETYYKGCVDGKKAYYIAPHTKYDTITVG